MPTDYDVGPFKQELASLLNRHSVENGSNTPDFILANYLIGCLRAFELASIRRDNWYGIRPKPGWIGAGQGGGGIEEPTDD